MGKILAIGWNLRVLNRLRSANQLGTAALPTVRNYETTSLFVQYPMNFSVLIDSLATERSDVNFEAISETISEGPQT